MSTTKIAIVIVISILVIIGVLGMQAYFIKQSFNKEETSFHQSVSVALRNTAKGLAKYNNAKLVEKGLIVRESGNSYEVKVNTSIDQVVLSVLLESEFDKQGMNIPFEYGIYDCTTNELVYSECCNIPNQTKPKPSKKRKQRKNQMSQITLW